MAYNDNADILTWKRVIENLQKKTDETVTEYNNAQQSRQSKNIKEGTWAIPETPEQVVKLKNLLKNPLDADTALNELGDVFGDDELFDTLEDMKENEPDTDVRHVVISRLKEMNFIKEVREGYKVLPPMDDKYQARDGLEGPFTTLSGKVVYYDPKEGKYYDSDTDMYMSYDEFQSHDTDYSSMKDERDEVKEDAGYSDKQIKMAFGILNDPRYKGGNYSGAVAAIEKLAKGLSKHPSVANALKRANESVNEGGYHNEQHEQLEYIHHVLQECGDGNMDITMVEQALEYVEEIREQHFDDEGNTKSEGVNEELELGDSEEDMAKGLDMSMEEFWELAERVGVDQYGGLTKDNYEDVMDHIVDNAERYKQINVFRKAGEFDGDK